MILRQRFLVLLLFVFMCCVHTFAQSSHESLRKGDKFYNTGDYQLAEENYRKAREKERDLKSTFNLGNTVYNQERYEEAVDHFTAATQLAPDNEKRSDAYYNLANSLLKNGDIEECIDAYKEAIQLNPSNEEAKYNLLVAKNALRQAQQQQQQQQQQQDGEKGENQEEQDKQEQQEQQEQEQDGEPQDQEDQEQQDGQEEQQDSLDQNEDIQQGGEFDTTRLDKQSLDSLDAMKLLQVIENEEKKVQEKLKKFNSNRKKPEKDW